MRKFIFLTISLIFFVAAVVFTAVFLYTNSTKPVTSRSDELYLATSDVASIKAEDLIIAQAQTQTQIEVDILELTIKESKNRNTAKVLESVDFVFQLKNTGSVPITNMQFSAIFDQNRLKYTNEKGLNMFFQLSDTSNGKKLIINDSLEDIIGSIEPGETKIFELNFILLRKATPTCINTTIVYKNTDKNATGNTSQSVCLNIQETSLNTDF